MFISTRSPLPPGTTCKLDVKLKDGYQLIEGLSEVAWTRERPEGPDRPPGMGLRFRELEEQSRDLIFEIVDRRLVEGGSVFQLDKAGEPLPQDIPELEDLLRRAEKRREEARQAESASESVELPAETAGAETEGEEDAEVAAFGEGLQWIETRDDAEGVDGPEDPAGDAAGEDGLGADELGEEELDFESLDFESEEESEGEPAGQLFGEKQDDPHDETSLTWTSGDVGQSSLDLVGEGAGPVEAEHGDGGADLDALIAETETPAGPPTEELEAFTAADQLTRHDMSSPDLSALLGSTPGKAGSGAFGKDGPIPTSEPLGDELSSPNLSDFLGDTGERPVLPSEVLASSPPAARAEPEEETGLDAVEESWIKPISRAPGRAEAPPPDLSGEAVAGTSTTPLSMGDLRRRVEEERPSGGQGEPALGEILGDRDSAGEPAYDSPMGRSVAEDSGVSYHAPADSRRPLILIVASVLLVAAVAGVYFWTKAGDGDGALPPPPPAVAQQEEPARPADSGPPAPEVVPVSPADSPSESSGGEAGGEGAAEPAPPAAEPQSPPPPPPSTASPGGPPMTQVQGIQVERTAEGTLVTLSLDGVLTQERYNFTRISAGSPRFLLRVLRVETGSHPEQVSVRTDEVDRVRTGYHGATSGQDLHVVLDLAAPTVTVERVESRGRELLIWAESR